MSLSVETLAVARKYTDDSLAGAGAVAGVPCKIQSITAITGGNRVTFLWTDNNGDDHTSAMDVMNGVDGEDGKGIQSVSINAQNHLIITYTDGTTVDAGWIEIHSSVDSVNGQTGAVVLDAEDVGALPDNTPIPSKTSDLTNDSGFATTSDVSTALADYTTTADLTTLLAAKQDTLTFDNVPTENSNNPVKSGGVYSANQNIYEVMGQMGTKNLITYPHSGKTETKAGITFTENADGSVTVNGTATEIVRHLISSQQFEVGKKYILSGCPSGGSHSLNGTYTLYTQTVQNYDDGEGVEFTWDASITGITIAVFAGITVDNLTFYPMIRLASDTDNTYQPYAKTNQELTVETQALTNQTNGIVNVLGAKNVLPFPYYEGSGTYNGVTITDNGDGSITLDGTCTGMSFFVFYGGRYSLAPTTFVKKNEDYIATLEVVSGSMAINSGTSRFVFRNYITNATSPFVDIFYEDNVIDTRSVKFTYEPTASYDTSLVWYEFNVGTTFNNWRIRPMIRLASITDDTYVPYAKTNQQLTEDSIDWDNFSELGAVNMLDSAIATQTVNDITVTNNGDGSYTVNCSSTEHHSANFISTKKVTLPKGTYKWTASADGKSPIGSNDCYAFIRGVNGTVDWYRSYQFSHGYGIITLTQDSEIEFGLTVAANATVSNLTFKPMITVASYNGEFVPYAKSNKELTELTSQLALNVISGNSGNVFDISCNVAYGRALVITPYSIGCLAYWSGAYHYIQIAANSIITVTVSNESSTGLTLTFTGSTVNVTIMSLTNRNDIWSGTRVS